MLKPDIFAYDKGRGVTKSDEKNIPLHMSKVVGRDDFNGPQFLSADL